MALALGRWPTRRIVLLWGAVVALYGALGIASLIADRRERQAQQAAWEARFGREPLDTLTSAGRDSVAALVFAVLRQSSHASPAQMDSLRAAAERLGQGGRPDAAARESLWRALGVPRQLSPAQRDSLQVLAESALAPVGVMLERVTEGLGKTVATIWAVLLTPAILAGGITAAWLLLRRAHRRRTPAAA